MAALYKRLQSAAGGGLLNRRSFLASGIAATVVPAAAAGEAEPKAIGDDLPDWMTALGEDDIPYGRPSPHEAAVVREAAKTVEETVGFTMWHTPIADQRGIITPNGLHFAVHHNGIPDIDPTAHRLMIHGLVKRSLVFDVADLLRYPQASAIHFLECSGNSAANALSPMAMEVSCQDIHGQVSGAEWTGVPLKVLLDEAGLKPGARWLIVEGADGGSHHRSLPLDKLPAGTMVALYQNGERLRPSQGYPMRLFIPGWEGNTNVKWLHRIEVTDRPAYSKDESGLYSEVLADGRIARFTLTMAVKSIITHPSGGQVLPERRGFYEISGLAWSGDGRVASVEVSADGGKSWAQATLHAPVLDRSLTRFSIPWRWDGRDALLLSRATDDQGQVQPTREVWKTAYAAHSFNHYNAIQVWRVEADGTVENSYA